MGLCFAALFAVRIFDSAFRALDLIATTGGAVVSLALSALSAEFELGNLKIAFEPKARSGDGIPEENRVGDRNELKKGNAEGCGKNNRSFETIPAPKKDLASPIIYFARKCFDNFIL